MNPRLRLHALICGLRYNQTPTESEGSGAQAPGADSTTSTGDEPPAPPAAPTAPTTPADNGGDDKPLGPNGERALAAERAANKELRAQLAEARKGGEATTSDQLAALALQLDEMKAENKALSLTNAHGLNAEDAAMLRTLPVEQMEAWAKRLATGAPKETGEQVRKPDPTQGVSGGDKTLDVQALLRKHNPDLYKD